MDKAWAWGIEMKIVAPVLAVLLLAGVPSYGSASVDHGINRAGAEVVEHGGGCRKSSPPGQCCHMDNRTGRVHCH